MSDRLRLLQALRDAGDTGVHTHDIRRAGISGNPSQRRIELLEQGHLIRVEREMRNGRPGARFFLEHDAELGAGPASHPPGPELGGAGSGALPGDPAPPSLFEPRPRGFGDLEEAA